MRKLLLLSALALVLVVGCRKRAAQVTTPSGNPTATASPSAPQPAPGTPADPNQPGVHAPTGVVVGSGGGGSGGAVQAVRQAVNRTVSQNELQNIRLFIENASATGQMPSVQEITQALKREAPKSYKLVEDKAIILTGVRTREGIWAYTWEPQTVGGEHLIVTSNGIERMNGQLLKQRLQQQGQ